MRKTISIADNPLPTVHLLRASSANLCAEGLTIQKHAHYSLLPPAFCRSPSPFVLSATPGTRLSWPAYPLALLCSDKQRKRNEGNGPAVQAAASISQARRGLQRPTLPGARHGRWHALAHFFIVSPTGVRRVLERERLCKVCWFS